MTQPSRQYRYLRMLQVERGIILVKLAWGGIFLSLVAFAYYLSGLFILFGGSVFFLLASYHLKHHVDDSPQRKWSDVLKYIDGSVSQDPLLPPHSDFDDRQTVYQSHPTEPQSRTRSPSLVKTICRHLDQEPEHSPHEPIRLLTKVALKSLDEAYHGQDRYRNRRRNESQICTHRARKWAGVEELRECPNCRRCFDEVLRCEDCGFMSCPDCRYFMTSEGWEASFGRLEREWCGGGGVEDGW